MPAAKTASADPPDQVRLGAATRLDGSRRRRSRHHLERTRPRRKPERMSPRMAWRAIQQRCRRRRSSRPTSATTAPSATPIRPLRGPQISGPGLFGPCGYGLPAIVGAKIGCPDTPVVGFAGDGAFGISMNEMTAIGRKEWPAITMVDLPQLPVGCRKAQHDTLVRRQLRRHRTEPWCEYAKIAEACGLKGVQVTSMEELSRRWQPPLKVR